MRKWEEKYESYKNGEMKQRFEELKKKSDNKEISIEEYKELQKMTKIMDNLPKVENLMEYINQLDNNLVLLKSEYGARNEVDNAKDNASKLDQEIQKNMNRQMEIKEKIKEINGNMKNLSEDEKQGAEKEKATLKKEYLDLQKAAKNNNEKYIGVTSKLDNIQKNNELKKYGKEEMREECFKIASKISKSNMVANNLMNGYSRESIQINLDNWKDRKFTAKTPLPLTRREMENKKVKKEDTEKENIEKENTENKTMEMTEYNEFQNEFPRLAKRLPFLKNNVGKLLVNIKKIFKGHKENEEVEESEEIEETTELRKAIDEYTKENDKKQKFHEYLKYDIDILDIAENGIGDEDKKRKIEKIKNNKGLTEEYKKKLIEKINNNDQEKNEEENEIG